MKAIAEYFRDLAAEDRYFGAEPPVPDAEMLARIAEREIARRVEAREERGSIVLRAAPYGAMSAPLAPFAAPQSPPAAMPVTMPATGGAAPEAPAQSPAPQATPATALSTPDTDKQGQPGETAGYVADAPAAKAAEPAEEWEDVAEAPATSPAPAPAPTMSTPPLRPTPVPHPDPDSVAAKLQRIRDVVTKSAAVAETHSYSEDEHADNFLSETVETMETALDMDDQTADDTAEDDDEIAALLSRLAQDTPAQNTPAQNTDDAQPDADDWDDESVEANGITTDLVDFGYETVVFEGENEAESLSAQDEEAMSPVAVDEDGFYDDPINEAEIAAAREAIAPFYEDLDETDLDEAELDEDESDIARSRAVAEAARVFTVKRAAFDAAIAKGELVADPDDAADEAEADDADTAAQDQDQDDSRHDMPKLKPYHDLSAEDEEALRRELAAVEAELVEINRDADGRILTSLDDEDFAEEDEDESELTSLFEEEDDAREAQTAAATPAPPLVLRDPRERLVQSSTEDDVSRLMAKTETALTAPENASKRNAIAHLRKAVAATKAEQSAGNLPDRNPATSAFREDLADVVRPRRPVSEAGAARPRPAETRPTPLKLVAEQRVDLPEGQMTTGRPDAPVRPRRVSLASLPDDGGETPVPVAAPVAEGGFADFAQKMGATALPDLLEAAAAYLVHVEGNDEFSRPQLMAKARQAVSGTLSREDGLRALGQLMRQGKLQKMRGGLFTASEDIGFKPDARRVG
ncbi:MAG: hypothetical protein ACNA7O_02680 [Rhodobacterales bacterium]